MTFILNDPNFTAILILLCGSLIIIVGVLAYALKTQVTDKTNKLEINKHITNYITKTSYTIFSIGIAYYIFNRIINVFKPNQAHTGSLDNLFSSLQTPGASASSSSSSDILSQISSQISAMSTQNATVDTFITCLGFAGAVLAFMGWKTLYSILEKNATIKAKEAVQEHLDILSSRHGDINNNINQVHFNYWIRQIHSNMDNIINTAKETSMLEISNWQSYTPQILGISKQKHQKSLRLEPFLNHMVAELLLPTLLSKARVSGVDITYYGIEIIIPLYRHITYDEKYNTSSKTGSVPGYREAICSHITELLLENMAHNNYSILITDSYHVKYISNIPDVIDITDSKELGSLLILPKEIIENLNIEDLEVQNIANRYKVLLKYIYTEILNNTWPFSDDEEDNNTLLKEYIDTSHYHMSEAYYHSNVLTAHFKDDMQSLLTRYYAVEQDAKAIYAKLSPKGTNILNWKFLDRSKHQITFDYVWTHVQVIKMHINAHNGNLYEAVKNIYYNNQPLFSIHNSTVEEGLKFLQQNSIQDNHPMVEVYINTSIDENYTSHNYLVSDILQLLIFNTNTGYIMNNINALCYLLELKGAAIETILNKINNSNATLDSLSAQWLTSTLSNNKIAINNYSFLAGLSAYAFSDIARVPMPLDAFTNVSQLQINRMWIRHKWYHDIVLSRSASLSSNFIKPN